jgi:predicted ArsR family transcriptional regulator
MARKNWNRWFFASTRGQIITLLRRSRRTVDELAQALALTHTAVRAHLAALERDGLVQQRSERRGSGKPSQVYDLTPAAEYLFPKSYGQLLNQLLDVLGEHLPADEVETLLREVGRRIAAQWKIPPGELRVRLEAAVEVFNELGGLMERETEGETLCIRGYRCPFTVVVRGHPEVCNLAKTLLSELVGVKVEERCDRNEKVSCRFVVPTT